MMNMLLGFNELYRCACLSVYIYMWMYVCVCEMDREREYDNMNDSVERKTCLFP